MDNALESDSMNWAVFWATMYFLSQIDLWAIFKGIINAFKYLANNPLLIMPLIITSIITSVTFALVYRLKNFFTK